MMTDVGGRLQGKVVLVTGGGRGIGRVIALRCARQGASVLLAGRGVDALEQVAAEVRNLGGHARPVALDLTDHEAVEPAIAAAADQVGPIDHAVANSGIAGPTSPLWEVTTEQWTETLDVNVTGVFLTLRAVVPGMIERGRGSVVVIGSMTGKRPLAHRTPYAASKTALVGLVRTAATDVGEHGVRVNLVSPGVVEGERLEQVLADQARSRGVNLDEVRRELASVSPLRRNVEADEVASAVLFLLSEEARAITGEDLNVSSGAVTY